MKEKGIDHAPALDAATYIYGRLKDVSSFLDLEYKHDTGIDFEYFEHLHSDRTAALSATEQGEDKPGSISVSADSMLSLPEELTNSAVKILEYSGIPEDRATCFMMNLTAFRNLKDRLAADETARAVRKAVADQFFDIYSAVLRKAFMTRDDSRLIRMFLDYGYMDEKLLDIDQAMAIYKLAGMKHSSDGTVNVYFMSEWLTEIYNMTKDPSVDNFGHDYSDTFRLLRNRDSLPTTIRRLL